MTLTDPVKSPRASKDTVQIQATVKLYQEEWMSLKQSKHRFHQTRKEPVMRSLVSPGNSDGKSSETDSCAVLSTEIILAIDDIIEHRISAALDRFAFAFRTAASQLHSTALLSLALLHQQHQNRDFDRKSSFRGKHRSRIYCSGSDEY